MKLPPSVLAGGALAGLGLGDVALSDDSAPLGSAALGAGLGLLALRGAGKVGLGDRARQLKALIGERSGKEAFSNDMAKYNRTFADETGKLGAAEKSLGEAQATRENLIAGHIRDMLTRDWNRRNLTYNPDTLDKLEQRLGNYYRKKLEGGQTGGFAGSQYKNLSDKIEEYSANRAMAKKNRDVASKLLETRPIEREKELAQKAGALLGGVGALGGIGASYLNPFHKETY